MFRLAYSILITIISYVFLTALNKYLNILIKERGEKVNFENYLLTMLTPIQIEILRLCLATNSPIHVYGPQGSGKTMLVTGLRSIGFKNITEPVDCDPTVLGPMTIPFYKEGLTTLRLNERPPEIQLQKTIPFEGHEDEIKDWVFSKIS